jgi:oxygen-independent coproporphyrinogen-3 oxidase
MPAAGAATRSIAFYVHFPFCLSICPYCDFDRQATGFDRVDVYLSAVERELQQYARGRERVHSIFFGGGTPSLMRVDQVQAVLQAIHAQFDVTANAEITLECNPGDADLAKLRGFRDVGATRLSFGIQSLDDQYLQLLGRRHSSDEARQAARWASEAGFAFNLDFMFGLPGQSHQHWEATLDQAVELQPDHLSCYLLTLDEKVQMGRDVARGKLALPVDDDLAEMYATTRRRLAQAGFAQYEISNWARPGQASRHNLTYWRDGTWIGVGAGAASSYGGRRWKNTPVLERYIASVSRSGVADRVEDEVPDHTTQMLDALTLGLRLREGVSTERFARRFGADLSAVLGEAGDFLLSGGFLQRDAGRVRIAEEHQLITNEILVRIEEAIDDYVRRETSASQIAAR